MRRHGVRENGESSGSSEALHYVQTERFRGGQGKRMKAELVEDNSRYVALLKYRWLSRLRIPSIAMVVNYGRRPHYSLVLAPHWRNIIEGEAMTGNDENQHTQCRWIWKIIGRAPCERLANARHFDSEVSCFILCRRLSRIFRDWEAG